MRNYAAIAGLGVAACLWAGVAGAEVRWSDGSFDQILQRAKTENKYVFIDFYTTWCGPCKMLDQQTYPDADVTALLNAMIPVKYDAEKGAGLPLAKQYKIHAYPTLMVLDPQGREVARELGFLGPKDFVTAIDGFRKGVGTNEDLVNRLRQSPDDPELLYTLGMKYADAGRAEDATPLLSRAMELDPKNETGRAPQILFALGEAHYNNDAYAQARPYFERVMRDYADSDWYGDSVKRLAATEYKLGDADAAVSIYWKTVEKKPDDPNVLNGFAWFCAQRKIGLDRALPAAQKAADLSGRDPGILDTLAEVYFAKGDFDNAIKVETEAAAKDPSDPYMKDQVEKFKKAKASSSTRS